MSKTLTTKATLCLSALLLSLPTVVKAADDAPAGRIKVDATPYYLDSAAAKGDGDIVKFRLYTSPDAGDPGTESSLNCISREFSARTGDQWSAPYKILPGESLYPVGKKLCDWDAKGLLKKYLF